jgi:hypothetical protein
VPVSVAAVPSALPSPSPPPPLPLPVIARVPAFRTATSADILNAVHNSNKSSVAASAPAAAKRFTYEIITPSAPSLLLASALSNDVAPLPIAAASASASSSLATPTAAAASSVGSVRAPTPAIDTKGLVSLSYSSVDEYMTCPLRYFYSYVQHRRRPPSIHLVLGRAMHDAVEAYALQKISLARQQQQQQQQQTLLQSHLLLPPPPMPLGERLLHDTFRASWKPDGCGLTPSAAQEHFDKALVALSEFHRLECASPAMPSLIEQKFVMKLAGRVRISGVWDRIDLMAASAFASSGGAAAAGAAAADASANREAAATTVAVIREYKKALSEYQLKTVKTNLQLRMYAWAFEAVFGFAPRHVQLEEIGSSRAAVYTPAVPSSDQVLENISLCVAQRVCLSTAQNLFTHICQVFTALISFAPDSRDAAALCGSNSRRRLSPNPRRADLRVVPVCEFLQTQSTVTRFVVNIYTSCMYHTSKSEVESECIFPRGHKHNV